jgi:hypothetical protein
LILIAADGPCSLYTGKTFGQFYAVLKGHRHQLSVSALLLSKYSL